jgi:quercetin dioxygenase-like cupin family protein
MGAGASAGIAAAVAAAKDDELKEVFSKMSTEDKAKVMAAMAEDTSTFGFASGLPDCCASNPESYKVVAEIPNARLVEMKMAAGAEDIPHEHPPHSMYFVTPAKLCITDYPDGKTPGEPKTVEIPAGAAPIFPPGAHQVKNIGDTEATVIFVEPLPKCMPCGVINKYVSPFVCSPACYKIHAENDEWITGELNLEPGASDAQHQHKDHLIYVLEGEEITIYPGGDMGKGAVVPIKPFAGVPAPMSAGDIFANHVVKNSGTVPVKMVFFEMKK